jgi:hypothetical protein
MKYLIIIIGLTISQSSSAQIRVNAFHGVSKTAEDKFYGAGVSAQFFLYGNQYFLPGINAGVQYENYGSDVISIPLQLTARKYVYGRHSCCGGAYLEANGGAKYVIPVNKARDISISQKVIPTLDLGIGYRTGMSFDYNFYYGMQVVGNKLRSSFGIRLGYNL